MTAATFEERLQALDARFEARIEKLEHERDECKKLAGLLQEQVERLKLGLLGQNAERQPKNDAQLSLAILNLALGGERGPVISQGLPICVALEPVDIGWAARDSGAWCVSRCEQSRGSKALFVFVGKRGHTMKVLTWDGTGAIIVHKTAATYLSSGHAVFTA